MSKVWNILTKPLFTVPFSVRTACLSCLIFLVASALGFWGAIRLEFAYTRSHQFEVLGKADAAELRQSVDVLSKIDISIDISRVLVPGRVSNLNESTNYLSQLRRGTPEDITGVVDLNRALNYLALARLEQSTNPTQATEDMRQAKPILTALGWQQMPDDKLMALADVHLRWRAK